MEEVLTFRDVVKRFRDREVLRGVSFTLDKGSFVVVYGEVGVGKSTLINLAHFQEFPDGGEVVLLGIPHSEARKSAGVLQNARRKVGVIKQIPVHLEDMTCYDNIYYVLEHLGYNRKVAKERTLRALERVGLADRMGAYPPELSAGQRQKLAIARTIAKEPVILLADDPTLGLDDRSSYEIEHLFMEINDSGTTVLWTSNRIPSVIKDREGVEIYRLMDGTLHRVS